MNLTITEGRFSEKQILESLSVDEYYTELLSYTRMKKQELKNYERVKSQIEAQSKQRKKKSKT
jgi:hypothetical protein